MKFSCAECGAEKEVQTQGGTGYGEYHGRKVCYSCCGIIDREEMKQTGKATLYLDGIQQVKNWPGTLCFPVRYSRRGNHNLAGSRTDIWFQGPEGAEWHGVQYGEQTQICHCRRLKA